MSVTRARFQRLMYSGLEELIHHSFREKEPQWQNFVRSKSSSKAFEEDYSIAGVQTFGLVEENEETPEDEYVPGRSKRYDYDCYKLMMGFSKKMIMDNKVGLHSDRARELGFSGRQTMEMIAVGPYADSFDSTVTGPDGVELCDAAHPNIRGGTQSNIEASPGDPSVLTIRSALENFRRFLDETGVRRLSIEPEQISVPPEQMFDAQEVMQSAGRPDTANRATNVIKGKLQVKVWDHLPSTTRWWVTASPGRLKIKFFIRSSLSMDTFEDENTEMNWVRGQFATAIGFSHWLGVWGVNAT